MMYGYARVSTKGQDLTAQTAELAAAGCGEIVTEKASAAAGRKRQELRRLMLRLEPGDCLVVTRLNRLARSALDALNLLQAVRERGADFKSLREAWADTTTPAGRLALVIMSGLAEFDREMILERTSEGREQARARGVRLGRPPTLNGRQRAFVRQERSKDPPTPLSHLAMLLNVSRATICRVPMESAIDAADYAAGDPAQIDLEDLLTADAG